MKPKTWKTWMTAMAENLSMEWSLMNLQEKTQPTKQKVWLHSLIPYKSHHPLLFFTSPQKRWPTSKPFPMLTCTLILPESSASKRLNKPRAFGSQHLNIQPKWWFPIGFPLPFEPERFHLPIPHVLLISFQFSVVKWALFVCGRFCPSLKVAPLMRWCQWCWSSDYLKDPPTLGYLPSQELGYQLPGYLWFYHGKQSKTSPR